jgi:NAD(P)-dependent dehydrogenase (short-subunit alcohol dehydrogenase family)
VAVARSETHSPRASRVEATGARGLAVSADVRKPEAVAAAFDRIQSELGLPDVLINNAAGNFPVPAEDMSPNAWRSVVEIVLSGTFHCSREFGRRHIAAGTPGAIVNVGASYAWTGGPGFALRGREAGVKNPPGRSRSSGATGSA